MNAGRALALLPMLSGPGDRHEDCQRYRECLDRASKVGGHAHCPEACTSYRPEGREVLREAGMVRRVSFGGNAQGGRVW